MIASRRFGALVGDLHDGSGRDLVVLHGQLLHRKVMDEFIASLGDDRVLNLDLPGHGESSHVAFSSMGAAVDAIANAIADAQLGRPVIVGHSLGAVVALHCAKAGIDIAGAMLLGCPGTLTDEQCAQQRAMGAMLDPLRDAVVDLVVQTWFSAAWREDHPETSELVRSLLSSNDVKAAVAVGNAIASAKSVDGPLDVPVGAVSFAEDRAAPRGPQADLMRSLHANEVIIASGHMAPVEAPAAMADAARKLLAKR